LARFRCLPSAQPTAKLGFPACAATAPQEAIGAKSGNILLQFLTEAVTLGALGGVIGVLARAGLSLLRHYDAHFPATLSFFWILMALMLCVLMGIGFDVYPAWKAAPLDPVEALRYE